MLLHRQMNAQKIKRMKSITIFTVWHVTSNRSTNNGFSVSFFPHHFSRMLYLSFRLFYATISLYTEIFGSVKFTLWIRCFNQLFHILSPANKVVHGNSCDFLKTGTGTYETMAFLSKHDVCFSPYKLSMTSRHNTRTHLCNHSAAQRDSNAEVIWFKHRLIMTRKQKTSIH